MVQIFIWINTFLCGLAVIFHCASVYTDNRNIYYPIEFFRTKIQSETAASCLTFVHTFTFIYFGYALISNTFVVIYIVTHIKNQLLIINNYLTTTFECPVINNDYDLVRNKNYQFWVSNKLKYCIQHHIDLKKYSVIFIFKLNYFHFLIGCRII